MKNFSLLFCIMLGIYSSNYAQTATFLFDSASNCSNGDIVVNASPAFQKSATNGIVACLGQNVSFDFGPTVASVNITYNGNGYSGNPVVIPAEPLPVINGSTSYAIVSQITYTDGTVCTPPSLVRFIFHSPPSVEFITTYYGYPAFSNEVGVTVNPIYAGNPFYDFTFTSPSGVVYTQNNVAAYSASTPINGEHGLWTITACDGYGCGESCITQTVNTNGTPCTTPSCSASGPTSGNIGTSYTFTAGTVTPAGSTVTWVSSGGGSPASGTGSTANVSWSTTGTKSVTFTVSNSSSPSGCSPASTSTCSANITISNNPCTTPSCSASGPSSGSLNTSYTFKVGTVTPAGSTVTWVSSGGGSPASGIGSTANVSWSTTGTKSVTFTVSNSSSPSGCSPASTSTCSADITISNNPPCSSPSCSATGPSSGTTGSSYIFTAGTIVPAGSSISWVASGGGSPASGTGSAATVSWATEGAKQVTFTVTNNSLPVGCNSPASSTCLAQIQIITGGGCDPVNPCTAFSYNGPSGLVNTSYQFGAFVVNPPAGTTYSWTATGGATPSSGTGLAPFISWSTTGLKTITFTSTNSTTPSGCSPAATSSCSVEFTVTQNNECVPINCNGITGPDKIYGVGETGTYSVSISPALSLPNSSYQWTITGQISGDVITATGSAVDITFNNEEYYLVEVTVTNSSIPSTCSPISTTTCSKYVSVGRTCDIPTCDITSDIIGGIGSTDVPYRFWVSETRDNTGGISWTASGGATPSSGTGPLAEVVWTTEGTKTVTFTTINNNAPVGCVPSAINECELRLQILSNSPLPVECKSFNAKSTAKGVQLDWETSSEFNNKGFNLMRSTDGINYELIKFIPGKGTSNNLNIYQFLDYRIEVNKKYYYKLIQLDYDGIKKQVCSIVESKYNNNSGTYIADIYPNPNSGVFEVVLLSENKEDVVIQMFDAIGKLIFERKEVIEIGLNKFNFRLNVRPNLYLLNVRTVKGNLIQKVLIEN